MGIDSSKTRVMITFLPNKGWITITQPNSDNPWVKQLLDVDGIEFVILPHFLFYDIFDISTHIVFTTVSYPYIYIHPSRQKL